jgi:hypothetical protein
MDRKNQTDGAEEGLKRGYALESRKEEPWEGTRSEKGKRSETSVQSFLLAAQEVPLCRSPACPASPPVLLGHRTFVLCVIYLEAMG